MRIRAAHGAHPVAWTGRFFYEMADAPCPNCHATLEPKPLEGLYGRAMVVDLCGTCHGIWFDEAESLQLAPRGTLDLFKAIHALQERPSRPLDSRLDCPRCGLRLSLATDQQRTTKFQYHRCPRGHGRFFTFFHFLRARNFVRSLTPAEVADLRARVRQVACSNCGAPLDLERDVACPYCRAPISMIDPDQVRTALAELERADARRSQIDPALPLTLLMERLQCERVFAEAQAKAGRQFGDVLPAPGGLVEAGLELVLGWFPSVE